MSRVLGSGSRELVGCEAVGCFRGVLLAFSGFEGFGVSGL